MDSLTMQNLSRATMEYLMQNLSAGMSLVEVRSLCERFMLENGADSFWYYDVGAFVFSGEETILSISGKDYTTADRRIRENDLLTVDLSPQVQRIWGDYARTIVIEAGKVVVHPGGYPPSGMEAGTAHGRSFASRFDGGGNGSHDV